MQTETFWCLWLVALPDPSMPAAQLVGCGFAGYRFYQHRQRVNGIHVKRIIQRHNEKHQHGEVRGDASGSHCHDGVALGAALRTYGNELDSRNAAT